MANQGGPNEIAAVSVGIGTNLDAMREGFKQAETEAKQAGEKIGKAAKDGIDGAALWKEMGGTKLGADIDKLVGDDAANKQAAAQDAGKGTEFNTMVTAVAAMVATMDKFEAIGEKIGMAVFEGAKQQLELSQAIRMLHSTLQTQIELQAQQFAQRTEGDKNVSSGMEKRKADLEAEQQALRERMATFTFGDVVEGAAHYTIGFGQNKTTRMQTQEQIDQNDDTLNVLRRQSTGIAGRQRAKGTTGGILESELGLDQNSVGIGQSLSPAQSMMFHDIVRSNQMFFREVARWQSLSYQQQQEEVHNRTTSRMVPIR